MSYGSVVLLMIVNFLVVDKLSGCQLMKFTLEVYGFYHSISVSVHVIVTNED